MTTIFQETMQAFKAAMENYRALSYAEIDALAGLLARHTVAALKAIAQDCGMFAHGRTKAKLIGCMVRNLKERKGSWERCQFRA